ncbi:hypothetical protein EPN42_06490 [bacterium]|nr:MAG: hypothetical protein EPN42_06490 [bacterium]
MSDTTTAATAITGVDATFYLVQDFRRAKAYWCDVMGLTPTLEGDQSVEFTLNDGATFGLYHMSDDSFHASGGVMFTVADVREAVTMYRDRGARIDEEVLDTPFCLMAFGEDTEGNTFILHQRK